VLPRLQLPARLDDHELAHQLDDAGFLGDRDESRTAGISPCTGGSSQQWLAERIRP